MNVFELFAKLTLDSKEYDKGIDKAKSSAGSLGSAFSKIGGAVTTAAKVGAAAIGAASTAVGALAMQSVSAYGEYQQMVGGVQKLYGNMGMSLEEYARDQGKSIEEVREQWNKLEEAQNRMMDNAQNAFKNAGMSANKYMEVATSFSAALINSLKGDTLKAADATDVAMRAISDNWNTFGGDLGMIQNAFMGFAKQNYNMLDNLKLGYGGTKKEMKRLIKDANEYAKTIGKAGNLSMDSFADIVTAIDLIQKKQNIAGTTAREASTTIQGSLGMVKAAWENLLTGMSDENADLGKLMGNLVDSLAGSTDAAGHHINGLVDNVMPVVEKALESMATFIDKVAPVIADKIPSLIDSVLPKLLSAGTKIVSSLGKALTESAPDLFKYVDSMMKDIYFALIDFNWAGAASEIADKISGLFDPEKMGLEQTLPAKALGIIEAFASGIGEAAPALIPAVAELLVNFSEFMMDEIPLLIETAADLISGIAEGLAEAIPLLLPAAVEVIMNIAGSLLDNVDKIIDAAISLMIALAEGLVEALPVLIEKAPVIIEKLIDALVRNIPKLMEASGQIIVMLVKGIIENLPQILEAGMEIVNSLGTGIIQMLFALWDGGAKMIETVWEGVKSLDPLQWGKDMIDSFIAGINDRIAKVADAARGIAKTVKDILGFSEPKYGPLADFHTFAPDMMELFAKGIRDNEDMVQKQLESSFNFGGITAVQQAGSVRGASTAESGGNTQTVILQVDRTELGRVVYSLNNEETRRIGVKLAGGVV